MSTQAQPSAHPADPLLETFWECGVVLFGERVRSEYALNTPFFIDLRHRLHDNLEALEALGRALHAKIAELCAEDEGPQQIVGIPDTATPIALTTALASRGSSCPLLFGQLRKKPANYPGGRSGASSFMGSLDPSRRITLIDDVMASGRTKLWSISELAKDNLKVARIVVVVDREQGGDRILEAEGYPVHSLYRASEIVDYFESTGRVDPAVAKAARDHLRRRKF